MSGARKFGEIKNSETGEVLVEMFGPGRSEDMISDGLRMLTQRLMRLFPENQAGSGFFGGEFGYGVNFENDTFLMHPYCWCEKAGECPWCTGCAIYQDSGKCVACNESHPHTNGCYQTEMNLAKKAAGLSHILGGEYIHVDGMEYDTQRKIEERIYRELCLQHGLDSEFGAAVHCNCGADESRIKAIEDRGCDYHFGRGIFTRFAPWSNAKGRRYYDPPNFWYKATDFRVTWYKYIGRDSASNRDVTAPEWEEILAVALASLGQCKDYSPSGPPK